MGVELSITGTWAEPKVSSLNVGALAEVVKAALAHALDVSILDPIRRGAAHLEAELQAIVDHALGKTPPIQADAPTADGPIDGPPAPSGAPRPR